MVATKQSGKPIDFSIMPSFHCNLRCWFCMYDSGPEITAKLDFNKTKAFLGQFDWTLINAFGVYGGEPSIDMPLYGKVLALVPSGIPKFVITNGTWSLDFDSTMSFLKWCTRLQLHVIVSSTPEHIRHQNRGFLEHIEQEFAGAIELKKPDEIHAQGRAKGRIGVTTDCKMACQRTDRNIRLGLKPDGNIVFQNCHGEYLLVQTYEEPFAGILNRTQAVVENCLVSIKKVTAPAPGGAA